MNWQWDNGLETGIEKIDEQHKELFRRIDQLELAIYKGAAKSELKQLVEYLDSYIIEHFKTEEKLLLNSDYPAFPQHVAQHNLFRTLCNNILNEYKQKGGDNYLAIDVDKQMRKWWENHIMKMDLAYVPYIKKS